MMMKIQYNGENWKPCLTHGKVYEVLSEERGSYRILDDTGEDYLYPPHLFTVVAE